MWSSMEEAPALEPKTPDKRECERVNLTQDTQHSLSDPNSKGGILVELVSLLSVFQGSSHESFPHVKYTPFCFYPHQEQFETTQ